MPTIPGKAVLGALLCLLVLPGAQAQSVVDGSEATIGAESAAAVVALVRRELRDPEARIGALHKGRAGALCGTVDIRNRMGVHTGPRGFVAEPGEGFFGRLPEGPELRNPSGVAEFRAMERARALFAANCTAG